MDLTFLKSTVFADGARSSAGTLMAAFVSVYVQYISSFNILPLQQYSDTISGLSNHFLSCPQCGHPSFWQHNSTLSTHRHPNQNTASAVNHNMNATHKGNCLQILSKSSYWNFFHKHIVHTEIYFSNTLFPSDTITIKWLIHFSLKLFFSIPSVLR